MNNEHLTFQKVIDDYLLWMDGRGYARATLQRHRQTLKHLQSVLANHGMDFNSPFSPEIIEEFKCGCHLTYRMCVVNSLNRFLSQGGDSGARLPKQSQLPHPYEDYMNHYCIINNLSARTIQHTRKVLRDFHRFLSNSGIAVQDLKIEHIDDFLSECNARYMNETVKKIRSSLRGLLRYLHIVRGILKKDLASLLIAAPVFARNNPPKFFRPHELQLLFAQPHTDDANILTCAMVHLAYCTGLRPSEIGRITLDDISFVEGQLVIPERKGRNPVQLPLPDEAIKAIAAYIIGVRPKSTHRQLFLNIRPPHHPLSAQQVSSFICACVKKIRPDASAYWLRHSYAQNLLESGASIFEIKEMLGHDDIKTTSRYLHVHTTLMRKELFNETI